MSPREELESLYERVGNGESIDNLFDRINELEDLLNPRTARCESVAEEVGCGCGHPKYCWDCAAIIGGCPEDA